MLSRADQALGSGNGEQRRAAAETLANGGAADGLPDSVRLHGVRMGVAANPAAGIDAVSHVASPVRAGRAAWSGRQCCW